MTQPTDSSQYAVQPPMSDVRIDNSSTPRGMKCAHIQAPFDQRDGMLAGTEKVAKKVMDVSTHRFMIHTVYSECETPRSAVFPK